MLNIYPEESVSKLFFPSNYDKVTEEDSKNRGNEWVQEVSVIRMQLKNNINCTESSILNHDSEYYKEFIFLRKC